MGLRGQSLVLSRPVFVCPRDLCLFDSLCRTSGVSRILPGRILPAADSTPARAWRAVSGGGARLRIRILLADVRYGCEEGGPAAHELRLQLADQAGRFGDQVAFRARWPVKNKAKPALDAVLRKVRPRIACAWRKSAGTWRED